MKIINRYILKEHLGPFVFALSALTSLMLLQYIARRFGDLVGKGLSWQIITEFFLLSIPFTLAMSLPMAVLVAVLYAFSRMASENEITALKAGGISARSLMVPSVAASVLLAIFMLWFNDQVLPRSNHELAALQTAILRTKPTFALRPQVINTVREGQLYLRAGQIDAGSGLMQDVTIYDLSAPARRRTIYADSGTLAFADNRRDLYMRLYDGMIMSAPSDHAEQLNRIYFAQDRLKVKDVANQFQTLASDTAMKGDREMTVCEMQQGYESAHRTVARALHDSVMAEWRYQGSRGTARGPQPQFTPPPQAGGIGAIYCSFIRKYLSVSKAEAAEVPAAAAVARAGAGPQAGRPPQGAAVSTPHSESVITNVDMVGARMRLDDARHRQNRYGVEIQKKFSLAASCIVLVLVGAPIALRFPRGGVGLVIAVSFSVFSLYYVGLIGGESLANKNIISPFWAMWADNIIFTIAGVVLIVRMGNEGVTSRGGRLGERLDALRQRFATRSARAALRSSEEAGA